MARILILIGAHLSTAPRPQKEAAALAAAGHDVTVGGFWFNSVQVARDRLILATAPYQFQPIVDFQPDAPKGVPLQRRWINRWTNLSVRLRTRLARELFKRFGICTPNLMGILPQAMLKYARQFKADLTIVHSEAGLWVGSKLLAEGFRVGVDFEDWFSEDLLPEAQRERPINVIKSLEKELAQRCTYSITTSESMAAGLATAYQIPKPTVIYNVFPWEERQQLDGQIRDRQNLAVPSLHWFSQTIGQGRGLEILFVALSEISEPLEIHLRGHYPESSQQWLEPQIPELWRDRIFIHPTVANHELLSRIAEHDIGLALEIPYCLNKQFTTSNKLFQYLQAGLAVIATETAGQKEVLSNYPDVGILVPSGDAHALAAAIRELVHDPQRLAQRKQTALKSAQQEYNWECQAPKLVALADRALRD
jgi:glycosyltransferase involved in cell wall biosynthesis